MRRSILLAVKDEGVAVQRVLLTTESGVRYAERGDVGEGGEVVVEADGLVLLLRPGGEWQIQLI